MASSSSRDETLPRVIHHLVPIELQRGCNQRQLRNRKIAKLLSRLLGSFPRIHRRTLARLSSIMDMATRHTLLLIEDPLECLSTRPVCVRTCLQKPSSEAGSAQVVAWLLAVVLAMVKCCDLSPGCRRQWRGVNAILTHPDEDISCNRGELPLGASSSWAVARQMAASPAQPLQIVAAIASGLYGVLTM